MATSTGSTVIAGDGTTEPIKTTTGIRVVGDTGINSKTAGDSATWTATSTGSPAISGDGITGGFMVRKAASTITARPATIETTISSNNRNNDKANTLTTTVQCSCVKSQLDNQAAANWRGSQAHWRDMPFFGIKRRRHCSRFGPEAASKGEKRRQPGDLRE